MEVFVINGSPGAGKSTLANSVSERLRESNKLHAVIDVDELGRVYPESHSSIMWHNLADVVSNYARLTGIKLIVPVCLDSQNVLSHLRAAIPTEKITICEATAPLEVLKARVSEREPNEYWQQKLREQVIAYAAIPEKYADFQIDTSVQNEHETTNQIFSKLGWDV